MARLSLPGDLRDDSPSPIVGDDAHATRAGKEVGVMQSTGFQRVHQRLQYMLLPDHFGEVAGSPLSGENLMRHARPSAIKGGDSDSHTPAPESVTTVAPFRAWRGSSLIAARGPSESPQSPHWAGLASVAKTPQTRKLEGQNPLSSQNVSRIYI